MQRMRVEEGLIEMTDESVIVRFTGLPGENISIGRQESTVQPSIHPNLIIVEGDNIPTLGEWLVNRVEDEAALTEEGSLQLELNNTYKRIAAIAIDVSHDLKYSEELDEETQALIASVNHLVANVANSRLQQSSPLEDRVEQAGMQAPDGLRTVLFAEHTAGRLSLFRREWSYLPSSAAHKFGKWILDGKATLKKKSIWDDV